ncbi:MAG: carotenoid biosynthesis protein, partial [Roseiflexaceae bacterium]
VPLAIPCAWLMVAVGADHFGFWILDFGLGRTIQNPKRPEGTRIQNALLVATLVLLLDLQIETVATGVNRYWVWLDGGLYYGVPMANFVAWWLVGLLMAALLAWVPRTKNKGQRTKSQATHTGTIYRAPTQHATRITQHIPACLYLLNTLMFTAINLARGYAVAGLVGVVVLLATVFALRWPREETN